MARGPSDWHDGGMTDADATTFMHQSMPFTELLGIEAISA
jgi:hypothetical protein